MNEIEYLKFLKFGRIFNVKVGEKFLGWPDEIPLINSPKIRKEISVSEYTTPILSIKVVNDRVYEIFLPNHFREIQISANNFHFPSFKNFGDFLNYLDLKGVGWEFLPFESNLRVFTIITEGNVLAQIDIWEKTFIGLITPNQWHEGDLDFLMNRRKSNAN